MKKNLFTAFIVSSVIFLMTSCIQANYIGRNYPPTTNVDLFFAENEVSKPHETMGLVTVKGGNFISTEKLQQKMIDVAKAKGADAVLIESMDEVTIGTSSSGSNNMTTNRNNTYSSNSFYTRDDKQTVLKVKFLKYTNN